MSGQTLQYILGQASMFDAGVVVTWDSPAEIGPERQRHILYGAVWTIIVHATNQPEDIGDLAGSKQVSEMETTLHYRQGRPPLEGLLV